MDSIDVHDDGDLKVIFEGVQKGLSFEEIRDAVSQHHADLANAKICTCGVMFECDVHDPDYVR